MKVGLSMNELYEKLKLRVFDYGKYPITDNDNAMIESLDAFVNELYSKENYSNDTYSARFEMRNMYRNLILLIINDYIGCKLYQFPNSIEQLQNLINQFYDAKLDNPIAILSDEMKEDLEKPEDQRDHTNDEWDLKMELGMDLAKYWDGKSYSNLYDIYNSLLREYPRAGVLIHWDYGLDQQSCIDLKESLNDKLLQSGFLEDAKQSLMDKHGQDCIIDTKYKNRSVYYNLLFNEILDVQNRIENWEDELNSDVNDDLDYDISLDPMAQAEALMEEAFEQSNSNRVSEFLEWDLASELIDPNSVHSDSK